jgi:hypothetical protein
MRRHRIWIAAIATLTVAPAAAQQQPPMPRPCVAIRTVCLQAGFVMQGARNGDGLIVDCIRPIMQGIPQPPRATKPLPAVDPQLVEACRAQNPNFGMGNAALQQGAPGMQGPRGPQGPQPGMTAPQDGPGGPAGPAGPGGQGGPGGGPQ